MDKLKNLSIAMEEDEDGVLGREPSNPQGTQVPTIAVISSVEQKCGKEKKRKCLTLQCSSLLKMATVLLVR